MKNKYKKRRVNGADRYGTFREGKQLTADVICGSTVWIPFTYLSR